MNAYRIASCCLLVALLIVSVAAGLNNAAALQPDPTAVQQGVEVLTRGPVHEAFAETVTFDPQPGLIAPKSPPAPIEELPPEQRPEGANVAWIPGYWAWDDERNDFLWISGIWRALPPGRQWVPGYWGRSGQGAQWTSGYWADANASEVEYLPQPPATIEAGPNVAAPSADHTWLPGSWAWQQNRYAWRPGYWAAGQSDWAWVPAHYVWTPRGYVFVDGYYDYSVARRGVVYAPVYFNSGIYSRPGFSYSPTMAISPAVFGSSLFLRPSYGHYYYGDYYGANYATAGYSPWHSYNSGRYGYDPFYAQQQWMHRQDRGWNQTVQQDFQNRRDHENARPPRTWADQARLASLGAQNGQNVAIAAPLDQLAKSQEHPLRFQTVNAAERQQLGQHGQAVHQLRNQRQMLEGETLNLSGAKSTSPGELQPARAKLPPSPIAALPADRLDKSHTPPQRHEVLKPDLSIEPTPRNSAGTIKTVPNEPQPATPGVPPREPSRAQPVGKAKEPPRVPSPERPTATPQPASPGGTSKSPQIEPRPAPSSAPPPQPRPAQPMGKSQGQSKGVAPERANSNPQPASKGRPAAESKGSPPGRANDQPQGAPQGKSPGEGKGKSK